VVEQQRASYETFKNSNDKWNLQPSSIQEIFTTAFVKSE
jgi:hypothetical protein